MLGLAHRGYRLTHPERHIVHALRSAGYWSGLIGEQHVSADPSTWATTGSSTWTPPRATTSRRRRPKLIADRAGSAAPFFLSVGFFETHREYFEPSSVRDALYSRPPENIVDTAATRRDMASFKASARALDQGVGAVLNALEEQSWPATPSSSSPPTTAWPSPTPRRHMYDRGIGVMLHNAWAGRFRARQGLRLSGEPPGSLPHHLRASPASTRPTGSKGRRSCRSYEAR